MSSRRRGTDFRGHPPPLLNLIGYEERKSSASAQGVAMDLTVPDNHYLPNREHAISVSGRMETLAYPATAAGQILSTFNLRVCSVCGEYCARRRRTYAMHYSVH